MVVLLVLGSGGLIVWFLVVGIIKKVYVVWVLGSNVLFLFYFFSLILCLS